MDPQTFFNLVYHDARSIGFTHVQASICAAQSALETGWGKTVVGNAYFGVKANKSWKGKTSYFTTHEVIDGKRIKVKHLFRAYDTFHESLQDYREMMETRFIRTWNAKNIEIAANALEHGKYGSYATDPKYTHNVKITAMKRSKMVNPNKTIAVTKPKSNIIPLYRPKQSSAETVAILDFNKDLTPLTEQNNSVKLLMIRGYYLNSMGAKGKNDRAIYDDAIFVVSPEGVQSFNANSDPSSYRKRIATVKSDQAIQYKPGPHGYKRQGGPYPAFRQNKDCIVERDGAGDDIGMFYVNLHRGGINGTSSAGCLTIPPHQWDEFYALVKGLLDKHKQKTFYVTLVEYSGTNLSPKTSSTGVSTKTVGILVSGGAIVSVAMEKFFGWFSKVLETFGSIF